MKLTILGAKAKESKESVKDKFVDGLGIELRTSLISYAESDAEIIAKYADLLMEMKTPTTSASPVVKPETTSLNSSRPGPSSLPMVG